MQGTLASHSTAGPDHSQLFRSILKANYSQEQSLASNDQGSRHSPRRNAALLGSVAGIQNGALLLY
jgi:hypothetical protein